MKFHWTDTFFTSHGLQTGLVFLKDWLFAGLLQSKSSFIFQLADLSDLDQHRDMFHHLALYEAGLLELKHGSVSCRTLRSVAFEIGQSIWPISRINRSVSVYKLFCKSK